MEGSFEVLKLGGQEVLKVMSKFEIRKLEKQTTEEIYE